ncbi:transposase [Streptomyces atratus]|uniref:transposase n=1 Tax=Streptomyces atratus TaxID=1893 RepID=UPI0033DE2B3C
MHEMGVRSLVVRSLDRASGVRGVRLVMAAEAGERVLTAVVPVWLDRADHARAHAACHASALLWNCAVNWVRGQWKDGVWPGREDIRRFVTSLPPETRPLHAHTAQAIAYDLADAISTARTNRTQGMEGVKFPWRDKKCRPLIFTARFGWRITPQGQLALSLGRGQGRILVPAPEFADRNGLLVTPDRWGEIKLCWDIAARCWSLHIAHRLADDSLPDASIEGTGADGVRVVTVAVDEGIINPMTLAAVAPDGAFEVAVINGRSARSIKRGRNKNMGRLQAKVSRCKPGSRRHRRLTSAKKNLTARTNRRLHDFNHQVTAKANHFIRGQVTAHERDVPRGTAVVVRLVVGDVRGIEKNTEKRRRASRSTRQQLSQWERGTQERQLAYKTGLKIRHIGEAYTSQTCPYCLTRRKVRGRSYVCKNKDCLLALHRDALGGVNIHTLAVNDGAYVPVAPETRFRVTYLRAQPGWSPHQRERHGFHQHAQARAGAEQRREARSSAQNRAARTDILVGAGVAVVPSPRGTTCHDGGSATPPGADQACAYTV